jgi:hypothetical protein
MTNIINFIKYNVGDFVILKNKQVDNYGNKPTFKIVSKTEYINSDRYTYQVLWFTDHSYGVAWNYEPYNINEKDAYYDAYYKLKNDKAKPKSKSKTVKTTPSKPNLNDKLVTNFIKFTKK